MAVAELEIPLLGVSGQELARLWVGDRGGDTIAVLTPAEAEEAQEAPIQLLEGRVYDYELRGAPAGVDLRADEIIQPNLARPRLGRIETGLQTGMLPIVLMRDGEEVGRCTVEVRTSKIDYRKHYRTMLNRISEVTVALLMNVKAPAAARMATDPHLDAETAHQRLAFVRAALSAPTFAAAVERVLRMPHERSAEELEQRDIRRGLRSSAAALRQIASATRRLPLPRTHALAAPSRARPLASVPSHIAAVKKTSTRDTAENRFVKYALAEFLEFIEFVEARFQGSGPADIRLRSEVRPLRTRLTGWLAHDLFGEISELRSLPLASSVLQRRPGYREILQTWLAFQLACRLNWTGGQDVFGAGKKDVAALYEYWVLFELLAIVRSVFALDEEPERTLIDTSDDHLDLRVKRAFHLSFSGIYSAANRKLRIDFSYNRSFPRRGPGHETSNYPAAGSWTRAMRPDYTISLWPVEYSLYEAERQELIAHVHFDAKYRIDELDELFGAGSDTGDDEDVQAAPGVMAKRDDLLKMHAYRDAIRRSEGAYVIYPGRLGTENRVWHAFHEVLPGLGAFALMPGLAEANALNIRDFLVDIAQHVSDEATRREQLSYHRFRIEEPSGAYRATPELPLLDESNRRLRRRPPEEAR